MKTRTKEFNAPFHSGGGIESTQTLCISRVSAYEEIYEVTAADLKPGYVNLPVGFKNVSVVLDFGGLELRTSHDDRRELIRLLRSFDEE